MRTVKKFRVNIPPGVKEGSRIRVPGKGEAGARGGPAGDLYVVTHVDPSPAFKRKGDNLEVEVPLTIPEVLLGAEVRVPTLDGSKTLRVKPGTRHGALQRLRGEGPPKLGGKSRGDIHYRFTIDVPEQLTDEQRTAVDELSKVDERQPARQAVLGGLLMTGKRVTRIEVETDRGVFMISVAAELASMHPQTLRMYESRGLVEPKRSPKGTRLYSQEDVEKLRRIHEMTVDLGLNLAGVQRVLDLESEVQDMHARIEELEVKALHAQVELAEELERVRRSFRAELVPYRAVGTQLVRRSPAS